MKLEAESIGEAVIHEDEVEPFVLAGLACGLEVIAKGWDAAFIGEKPAEHIGEGFFIFDDEAGEAGQGGLVRLTGGWDHVGGIYLAVTR
jgi:hypothetical protein